MNKPLSILAAVTLTLTPLLFAADANAPRPATQRVPLIDVTDLYHPHQDVGDNFDIIAAYALPEIDLKAVILDSTEKYRRDGNGRDAGFIPVLQMNTLFDRDVPCATTPYTALRLGNGRVDLRERAEAREAR